MEDNDMRDRRVASSFLSRIGSLAGQLRRPAKAVLAAAGMLVVAERWHFWKKIWLGLLV